MKQTNYNKLKFVLLVSTIITTFFAQAQTYNFSNYGVKDGLIQSNINDVLQDKNGFIWFATDGGLSKFDGKNFTNYSTYDGLSETAINTICEDKDGNIWIGHTLGKITVYDGKKFKPFELKTKEKINRIRDISLDHKNNIWIATIGSGAIYIDTKTKNHKIYSINEGLDNNIYSVYTDVNYTTWFATEIGIKNKKDNSDKIDFFKPNGFPFFVYSCITADKENMCFGTYANGVIKYNLATGKIKNISTNEGLTANFVTSMVTDKNGNIWVGTWQGGLSYIEGEKVISMRKSNGLSGDKIRCVFIDNENIVWAGLQDAGISAFKGFKFINYTPQDGINNGIVNAITKDIKGRYWFGTNEGITVFDNKAKNKRFTNINPTFDLRDNLITSFAHYNNKIYVSAFKGDIGIYNQSTLNFENTLTINQTFINDLNVINDVLWISHSSGITTYNFKTNVFKDLHEFDLKIIVKTFVAKNGTIWIGNRESGLMCYKDKKLIKFTEKDGFTHNSPTSFCEDNEANLWIGTEGGGLFKYQDNKFQRYTVKNGLLSDFVTILLNDKKGNLLVGTNTGLSKFNAANYNFVNYTASEGFTAIETKLNASYLDTNGTVWLGTINGVTAFNPLADNNSNLAPILYLNSYDVFSTNYPISDHPSLNYNQNEITFKFTALHYLNPTKIQFKYKLEHFDEKWKFATGINSITYSHLPPGDFKFIIMACTSEGVCTSKPIEFQLSIIPPIYQRVWFIIFVSLIFIVGLWSYTFFRTKYLRNAKIVLEKQVKSRTIEIEEKNNTLIEANQTISTKNKEITDSINYAKRIQEAILPSSATFRSLFPKSFILYHPKDIVSGDFYWYTDILAKSKHAIKNEHDTLIAIADCTGHGVPGAFMCMIGSSLLNQIVQETQDLKPDNILNELHIGIREALKQSETDTRDGMDIALCHINRSKNQIEFAGALRPLLMYRGKEYKEKFAPNHEGVFMQEYKADKFPIGGLQSEDKREFTNHLIDFYKGDTIYLFTDGFADQFGGLKGKKLMTKKFKEILSTIQDKNMLDQFNFLDNFMNEWKSGYEQVDDILVVGIKF